MIRTTKKKQCRSVCFTACVGVLLATVFGCASTAQKETITYETVAKIPKRDTEQALRENDLAVSLIKQNKYDQAELTLRKALSVNVAFGPAHNNLGKVYYHQAKYYLAAWEFQYAIMLMPHHPEPKNNLGLVFEAVGKLDDAVDAYTQALNLQPDHPQMLGNLARARFRRGDRGEEITNLLSELIMKDTRPEWTAWAREKLALMNNSAIPSEPEQNKNKTENVGIVPN